MGVPLQPISALHSHLLGEGGEEVLDGGRKVEEGGIYSILPVTDLHEASMCVL
jgi:hypothetical protein